MTAATAAAQTGTQAIDRAADLLARVVLADDALTFTELAAESGYARSTTSRLLAALERAELLDRDEDGGWVPGPLFAHYAARRDSEEHLARASRPTLQRLGDLTGETVNLGVARGATVIQVAQVDATFFLGSRNWVGVDVPPHTSALGKVLYAYGALTVPSGPLEQLTPASVATGAALESQLVLVRESGYAVTVDELEPGLTGVAAPVIIDGRVVAALGISGPTSRLAENLQATGEVVAQHARGLSSRLTRRGPTHPKEGAA